MCTKQACDPRTGHLDCISILAIFKREMLIIHDMSIRNQNRKRSQMSANNAISLFSNVSDFLSFMFLVRPSFSRSHIKIPAYDCAIVACVFFIFLVAMDKSNVFIILITLMLNEWDLIIQFWFFVWKLKAFLRLNSVLATIFKCKHFNLNCNKYRMKLQFYWKSPTKFKATIAATHFSQSCAQFILVVRNLLAGKKHRFKCIL